MASNTRYRWRVTRVVGDDLTGAWHPTREHARQDAKRAGVAKCDPVHGWFFDVLTRIESSDDVAD